jgi:hypothetical protein
MLVILSRDPHPVQGSTIERAFVLCRTAYNGDPHAVQTSAVQNCAEPAHSLPEAAYVCAGPVM